MKPYLLFLLLLPGVLSAINQSEAEAAFQAGNQHFSHQHFKQAIESYQQALAFGQSPQVYHNIGQAYAHNGQYGWALAYLLKAQRCDPRWQANRQAIQQLYTECPDLYPPTFPWYYNAFTFLTDSTWRWMAAGAFWVCAILLTLYFLDNKRTYCLALSLVFGGMSLTTSIGIMANAPYRSLCVLPEKTTGYFAPSTQSPTRYQWPMGTFCWIKAEQADYYFVSTLTGEDGWILKKHLFSLR